MRLPTQTYDTRDLLAGAGSDGPEEVMSAEEYLQPQGLMNSMHLCSVPNGHVDTVGNRTDTQAALALRLLICSSTDDDYDDDDYDDDDYDDDDYDDDDDDDDDDDGAR